MLRFQKDHAVEQPLDRRSLITQAQEYQTKGDDNTLVWVKHWRANAHSTSLQHFSPDSSVVLAFCPQCIRLYGRIVKLMLRLDNVQPMLGSNMAHLIQTAVDWQLLWTGVVAVVVVIVIAVVIKFMPNISHGLL